MKKFFIVLFFYFLSSTVLQAKQKLFLLCECEKNYNNEIFRACKNPYPLAISISNKSAMKLYRFNYSFTDENIELNEENLSFKKSPYTKGPSLVWASYFKIYSLIKETNFLFIRDGDTNTEIEFFLKKNAEEERYCKSYNSHSKLIASIEKIKKELSQQNISYHKSLFTKLEKSNNKNDKQNNKEDKTNILVYLLILGVLIWIISSIYKFFFPDYYSAELLKRGIKKKDIYLILKLAELYFYGKCKDEGDRYREEINFVEALYYCYYAEALGSPDAIKLRKKIERKTSDIQKNVALSKLKEDFGVDTINALIQFQTVNSKLSNIHPFFWPALIWSLLFIGANIYLNFYLHFEISTFLKNTLSIILSLLSGISILFWLKLLFFNVLFK